MITANVITRTFHLKYRESIGTCFIIDIENKQYFVTAKHVVENIKDGETVSIYCKGSWIDFPILLTGHSINADISVFVSDFNIVGHPLPATTDGIVYGQDLYFLGFPFGLRPNVGALNRDFPLPLVKKGILSAIIYDQPGKYFLIDGHNNPGFSGGPVVFRKNDSNQFNVAAIISAYRYDLVSTILDGKPTPIKVRENTGIIIAYNIDHALELIKANPNGKSL